MGAKAILKRMQPVQPYLLNCDPRGPQGMPRIKVLLKKESNKDRSLD